MKQAIYVGATGQNVGKTTLCLGLIAALQKKFSKVGFIKPLGQQHIQIDPNLMVDKDVVLFKEYFKLPSSYSEMSPVIFPSGFTRAYLDGKICLKSLENRISNSFEKIYSENSYTIAEGTGHVGVGGIVDLNNARVASLLNLDMVLIASGGLGSTFDELSLNLGLCDKAGIKIRGIILNQVHDKKREMILNYFPRALKKWGVPLLGCVPYHPFLSTPSMEDYATLFEKPLIAGEVKQLQNFTHIRLVAGDLHSYYSEAHKDELIITPASRNDIIAAVIENYEGENGIGGLILTGRHPPAEEMLAKLKEWDIPSLYAPICSYDAMKMITSFKTKTRTKDKLKIEQAIRIVETYVDLDLLIGKNL